jgi:hypothetical protein
MILLFMCPSVAEITGMNHHTQQDMVFKTRNSRMQIHWQELRTLKSGGEDEVIADTKLPKYESSF